MRLSRFAGYFMLWAYAAVAVIPMIVMVIDSLRPNAEVLSRPLALPDTLDFASYSTAWTQASFSTYVRNSVLVTVGAVALDVIVSLPASYALGRFPFRGSG